LEQYYNLNYRSLPIASTNFVRKESEVTWCNRTPRTSYQDFGDYFRWVVDHVQYSLALDDGSCIQIFYQTRDEVLVKGSLAYLPSMDAREQGLRYLRFDCDTDGGRDLVHTAYHVHFDLDSGMRISLLQFPSPSVFLDFIMLVAYQVTDQHVLPLASHIQSLDELNCRYSHFLHLP
jgi:hypothetical protein